MAGTPRMPLSIQNFLHGAHISGEPARRDGLFGIAGIKAKFARDGHQGGKVGNIAAFGEMGLEEGQFHVGLTALQFGPFDQLMRAERVYHAAVIGEIEGKPQRCAQFCQTCAGLDAVFRCRSIFFRPDVHAGSDPVTASAG